MKKDYDNKQIGNADFKSDSSLRIKGKGKTDEVAADVPVARVKLKKFHFPSLHLTIEAENLAQATEKLKDYQSE